LTIRIIQKIVKVQFILFVICFIVVCILSLTYRFTCLGSFRSEIEVGICQINTVVSCQTVNSKKIYLPLLHCVKQTGCSSLSTTMDRSYSR
jgi:hypothetical protein